MSIYLRGGIYWAYIYINGRRVRKSLGTNDKRLAEGKAQELRRLTAETTRPAGPSLEAFALRYFDWAWSSKPASTDREEQRWKSTLWPWFKAQGITHMAQITPYHVEQLKAKLAASGKSKATVNRYLQLVRGMINRAVDWDLFEGRNPVSRVKLFREDPQVRPLTADELTKVLSAAKAVSEKPLSSVQRVFFDLCVFALNTGMRKSEIFGLKWADVREGEAFIRGKGDRARRVPLNPAAAAVVARQPKRSAWVFHIPNREQQDCLRRTVRIVSKASGVEWHFHLLRHAFTTSALAVADFVTVSKILGHGRTQTSLLYSHSTRERARDAVDKLPIVAATAQGIDIVKIRLIKGKPKVHRD